MYTLPVGVFAALALVIVVRLQKRVSLEKWKAIKLLLKCQKLFV